MIHPDTELCWINPEIGHGVRATRRIPKGTLTWVRCALDRVLTRAELDALGDRYRPIVERFAYVDHLDRHIFCWDAGRHVNHHCDANSRALGLEAQIAIRDIEPGEELTCDYGECNLDEALTCHCGAAGCRGSITAADLRAFAERWDAEIRAAVAAAVTLDQPLLAFTSDPVGIAAILRGSVAVPSILCVAGPRSQS
jgi:SET domain-containing protein